MPITETIGEQIVQAIVTALNTIRRPTYGFNVRAERLNIDGNSDAGTNCDALAIVNLLSETADWSAARSFGNRLYKDMRVGVSLMLGASATNTMPPDAAQSLVIGYVQAVVEMNRQWGGLACYSDAAQPKIGYDGRQPGADVIINVQFFTNSTDPTSLS